ncbi:MAG TPA: hypothetical protein VLC08_05990, partial [Chitinolyticbacter sp.]|nr:hypothetical protein [Chitinolyticbacter sp.]
MNVFTPPTNSSDLRKIAAWRVAILQDDGSQPVYGRTLEVSTGSIVHTTEQSLHAGTRAQVYLELPTDGGQSRLYADFKGQLLACTLMQGGRFRMQWRVQDIADN